MQRTTLDTILLRIVQSRLVWKQINSFDNRGFGRLFMLFDILMENIKEREKATSFSSSLTMIRCMTFRTNLFFV